MNPESKASVRTFLIADDSEAFLRILRQMVESHPQGAVSAEAHDGQEAVRLAEMHSPDVVLMDVVMPGMNGIQAAKQIKQSAPATRIILFSAYHEEEFRFKSLQAGAEYFVWKEELNGKSLMRMIETLFPQRTGRANST